MNLNREFPVAAANEWADDSDKRMLRLCAPAPSEERPQQGEGGDAAACAQQS